MATESEEAPRRKYYFKAINNIWQFYGQVEKALLALSYWEKVPDDAERFDFVIADRGHVKYSNLHSGQTVNYYRGHREITDKAAMAINLRAYCAARGVDPNSLMPLTFVLYPQCKDPEAWLERENVRQKAADDAKQPAPDSSSDASTEQKSGSLTRKPSAVRLARVQSFTTVLKKEDERELLRAAFEERKASGAIWIAKSTQGAKGDNICVSRDLNQLLAHVDADFEGLRTQSWVMQLYIEKPYLIHNRKFDIRSWVVLDSQYRIYHFREGVCRMSSEPFHLSELENRFVHLTNHCIQTGHPNYGQVVQGNEMFFEQFEVYLRESGSGKTVAKDLMPQLNNIIIQTFLCIKEKMELHRDYRSIQIFGFDFMLDANFKAYLIEINATPASAEKLLCQMVDSYIARALDPIYPPPPESARSDKDNLFDLIYTP